MISESTMVSGPTGIQCPTNPRSGPSEEKDLFAMILDSVVSDRGTRTEGPGRKPMGGAAHKASGYLEALRRSMLAVGRPLERVLLDKKDLSQLQAFLYSCGFSKEDVERLFDSLSADHPGGSIPFSEFMNRAFEIAGSMDNQYEPVVLESSSLPRLESILRDLGFDLEETDRLLNLKSKDGGLSLGRFIAALRSAVTEDRPSKTREGIEGLIRTLEQIYENSCGSHHKSDIRGANPESASLIADNGKSTETTAPQGDGLPEEIRSAVARIVSDMAAKNVEAGCPYRLNTQAMNPQSPENLRNRTVKAGDNARPYSAPFTDTGDFRTTAKTNAPSRTAGHTAAGPPPATAQVVSGEETPGRIPGAGRTGPAEAETGHHPASFISEEGVTLRTGGSETVRAGGEMQNTRQSLPFYLVDQAARQIARSIIQGDRTIRLRLRPPELGMLRVEMDLKDNVLKLGITAGNSSVRDLLLSQVNELRDSLVEQGLRIERMDIQINPDHGGSTADARQGTAQGHGWGRGGETGQGSGRETPEQDVLRPWRPGDRLIDLMA